MESETDKDQMLMLNTGEINVIGNGVKATEVLMDDGIDEEDEDERQKWTRGMDFILSLIGYAVGVSNLWRFPYLCLRNGGGAFLIPFFFFLIFCGIPLFYLEVCLGQFSGTSSMFVWKMCPLFKGLGYGMVVVSGMACIYYNAVLSWIIYYLVNSFQADLPWASCGNWWNTDNCTDISGFSKKSKWLLFQWPLDFFNVSSLDPFGRINDSVALSWNNSMGAPSSSVNSSVTWVSALELEELGFNLSAISRNLSSFTNSSKLFVCGNFSSLCYEKMRNKSEFTSSGEEFWQYNVLRKSEGLDDLGGVQLNNAICLLAAWVLVCLCLIKGVKSLGKVVYVTALTPYLLLTIFLIRGLMLPGAFEGIRFYVTPDFSRLANFTVWIEACVQVFYSLGPAWGGLITMASFNKFNNNCFKDVLIASLADGLTSFYGGFVIFAVIGFMAHEANVEVTEVATQGPGLALVAYPEAISKLPIPQLWAILFFFMLLLLGLDSQFGMFETVITGLIDAFPKQLRQKRVYLTFGLAFICYCISLPIATRGGIYVFTLLDWYVAAFCVMLTSLIECLIIGWIYGVDRFSDDIEIMIGKRPGLFMKACWTVVTPLVMMIAFIFTCAKYTLPVYDDYVFPKHANVIGFLISVIPLIPIVVGMVYVLYKESGTFSQRLEKSLQPAADWGPAPLKYKSLYLEQRERVRDRPHWMTSLIRRREV